MIRNQIPPGQVCSERAAHREIETTIVEHCRNDVRVLRCAAQGKSRGVISRLQTSRSRVSVSSCLLSGIILQTT
jgi:hypothetical protein